jgi:uncharacterized protein
MFINVIESSRLIVAACDKDLMGKKFEENTFQLDVKETFYKGEEKSKEESINLFQDMKKEDATFNLVGNKTIEAALEAGIIVQENISKIDGIPFALVLL